MCYNSKCKGVISMTINEMVKFSNEWLKDNYNLELDVPIEINNRLSSALGKIKFRKTRDGVIPTRIEMNGNFVRGNTVDEILMTLKHELVHYALIMLKKPFRDGQEYFESELLKHHLPSNYGNGVVRNLQRIFHVYECDSCKDTLRLTRRINVSRVQYVCGKCQGNLVYKGQE